MTRPEQRRLDKKTAILLSSLSISVKSARLVWRWSYSGGDVLEDIANVTVTRDGRAANGAPQVRPCSASIYVRLLMLQHEGVTRG